MGDEMSMSSRNATAPRRAAQVAITALILLTMAPVGDAAQRVVLGEYFTNEF
jgi:hypothetical protein